MSWWNSARETRASQDLTQQSIASLAIPARGRGRGSRSPSPAARVGGAAFFPETAERSDAPPDTSNTMGDINIEELQRIAQTAANAAASASAALAAMTQQLRDTQLDNSRLRAIKKPDLPTFDQKNIEIWIRRVESAFTRVGVDNTKDKFAFLEAKLSVDLDPKINSFLFGPIDDNTWSNFTAYLIKKFGKTRQQRTAIMIDGIQRDGRRPSEMLALFNDMTQGVTLDDIRKEHLLKQLPVDVRRALAKESNTLMPEQLAESADAYFDQQGRPKFNTPASTINAVDSYGESTGPLVATTAERAPSNMEVNETVNAVRRQPSRPSNKPPLSTSRPPSRPNSNRQNQRSGPSQRAQTFDANGNCYYHAQFGTKADRCFPGCKHPHAGRHVENNNRQGNEQGGQRK